MLATTMLDAIGDTPLVELDQLRPEGGAPILAKWEGANPTGSMKDRMALAMIRAAQADGRLQPGQRVVEVTGGSTGSSLALVCAVDEHPLSIVTADCFSEEKIATMRALGADVEVLSTPEGKVYPGLIDRAQARAREIVEETGAYWTQQHANPDQLEGYASMAREILEDRPGVTDLVTSVGTAGSAMGTAQGLRKAGKDVTVTLVEPSESPYLSKGEGGSHGVEGIAVFEDPPLLDPELYDDVVAISEADGIRMARQAARTTGLFAGKSTGLNLAAAQRVAKRRGPDDAVVTIAVDTGLKYLAGSLYREA